MVTNGRSPNSLGWLAASQRQLGFPVQHTADLFPMDQVIAVKQGNAGKKLKGAGHKIIIVSHPADAGIGITTGKQGIDRPDYNIPFPVLLLFSYKRY